MRWWWVLSLVVPLAGLLLWGLGRSPPSDAGVAPRRAPRPGRPARARLLGRGSRAPQAARASDADADDASGADASDGPPGEDDAAWPDDSPPDVYTTPDPDPAPVREGPVVVTVHVVHALGTIDFEPDGFAGASIGSWSLTRHEDEGRDDDAAGPWVDQGPVPASGRIDLVRSDVEAWRDATLFLDLTGGDFLELERPPDPVPREIVVRAPSTSKGDLVRFGGVVEDETGRPVAGAGVFLESDQPAFAPGTVTARDGRFRLELVSRADPDAAAWTRLDVVARGYALAEVQARPGGEEGIRVTLAPESQDGSLELCLRAPDGSAAGDARVLLEPVDRPFVEPNGLPEQGAWDGDPRATQRRLLARLLHGQALEMQGWWIGQDSIPLLDLATDDEGRVFVPALPPGRYQLHAILPEGTAYAGRQLLFGEVRAASSLAAEVEVRPPPEASSATLRFPAGRTVTGRVVVAVDPTWHCGEDAHVHFVRAQGWPWQGVEVESGRRGWARGEATSYSGRFRLDGMAPGPLELRVWTVRHGEVVVDVPAGDPGGTTDLGDVVVPDVGVLYGLVTIGAGRTPAAAGMGGLRAEVRGGEGGEMHEVGGDGRFQVTLPERPAADAALVVTSTSPEKELVRVPWPFDLGTRDHPLPVTIPAEAVPNPSAPSDDGEDAPR